LRCGWYRHLGQQNARKLPVAAQLRAEGVFVQPDFRRMTGDIVDGEHVKACRTIVQVAVRRTSTLCFA
jgi:hypothetical protein